MIIAFEEFSALGSSEAILTALAICSMVAVTVLVLKSRADALSPRRRPPWMAMCGIIAGLGFSTAHLVALLGFRPDMALSLDPMRSLLAALVGLVLIGGPLAATVAVGGRGGKAMLGAAAGVGIGAMHLTSVSALRGCVALQDWLATGLATALCAAIFAWIWSLAPGGRRRLWWSLLLVTGVCAPRLIAVEAMSLTPVSRPDDAIVGSSALMGFIALGTLVFCVAAVIVAGANAQLQAQARASRAILAQQNSDLKAALHHMSNGLILVMPDFIIGLHNDRVRELLSLEHGDVAIGMPLSVFLANAGSRLGWDEVRVKRVFDNHLKWMSQDEEVRIEHHYDDGSVLRICCRPMPDGGAILTYDDVTQERTVQAEMTHMAYHDTLTGLPNRRNFRETIQRLLATTPHVGVLMLDLDRFKVVNDTLGHGVGDALLVQAASRLREGCRHTDLIFRLGGDELAILPQPMAIDEGEELGQRLVTAFSKPFVVEGHTISIGCSVGYAVSGGSEDSALLMQMADLALYRAKELGRCRMVRYEAGMMEKAIERRQIEADLIRALGEGELELYYQPLCALPGQRLVGFEALIRWNHPERGRVAPADFIPLAEENGTIVEIGAWVLDEACRQAALWPEHLHVAVNISPVQMRQEDIVAEVISALRTHGVAPHRLELELTETALVEDGRQIAQKLQALRKVGVRIAMDDFGTGYSSLAHLRDFELDRIKIDRSFIDAKDDDIGALAVIRAVTGMARDLSILTVGEGVETDEQLARLVALGCDAAQGYFLGKPMDAAAATGIVMEQQVGLEAVTMLRLTGS